MTVLKIAAMTLAAVTMLAGAATAKPLTAKHGIATGENLVHKTRAGFQCVAVGRTVRGRRIPGVRGAAHGAFPRNVCRRAMRRCIADLHFRQRRGLNPFGRCRVERRGYAFRF